MIEIKNKEDCVGCNACVQRCPVMCIILIEDEQGFLYPKVDLERCIDCHLCEKVCPVINQGEPIMPLQTYAAKNKDKEIQRTSSSGGVFYALAQYVIEEKHGVVFGARFDNQWEVIHDYAMTLEEAKAFKGSKYVQSRIGDNYKKVEDFLKAGRSVLFSGTPCQIAGLKLFLRKEWGDQLLTVEVVCHGVPSPLVWRKYLEYVRNVDVSSENSLDCKSKFMNGRDNGITNISFRDKRVSWEKFGLLIYFSRNGIQDLLHHDIDEGKENFLFETLNDNLYLQGFLNDLYLRPSCYVCPAKCGKSNCDIAIADFWGIASYMPRLHDSMGVSLVLMYTAEGEEVLTKIPDEFHNVNLRYALAGNPAIERSAKKTKWIDLFWQLWDDYGIAAISLTLKKKQGSFPKRAIRFVTRRILRYTWRIYRIMINK